MTVRPVNPDPRILIVEDEPRMRDLLMRAVTSWGFSAEAAHSAEEAVRHMEARPSEIVLLDLNLPGMNGLEGLEVIRQRWPKTQAIILTGFGDLESARKAIHLDVVEFLTKPCHLGELEVAIDRAVRRLAPAAPSVAQPIAPPPPPPPPAAPAESGKLEDLERQHILATLARNKGNRSVTATELGISLRTLYYRLSEYQRRGYNVD